MKLFSPRGHITCLCVLHADEPSVPACSWFHIGYWTSYTSKLDNWMCYTWTDQKHHILVCLLLNRIYLSWSVDPPRPKSAKTNMLFVTITHIYINTFQNYVKNSTFESIHNECTNIRSCWWASRIVTDFDTRKVMMCHVDLPCRSPTSTYCLQLHVPLVNSCHIIGFHAKMPQIRHHRGLLAHLWLHPLLSTAAYRHYQIVVLYKWRQIYTLSSLTWHLYWTNNSYRYIKQILTKRYCFVDYVSSLLPKQPQFYILNKVTIRRYLHSREAI